MQHCGITAALTVLIALHPGLWLRAQEPVDSQRVQRSIDLGVQYLLSVQLDSGGWPEHGDERQNCGLSALSVLALLNSGVSPDRPQLRKALDYLRQKKPLATYSVSLQTMALCAATPERDLQLIQRNCEWLIQNQLGNGGWSYPGGSGDPSNSQFALLALHEAERIGVPIPAEAWKECLQKSEAYWLRIQNADGSFPYAGEGSSTGSMTCAGIASLIITGSQLSALEAQARGNEVACCQPVENREDRIRKAMNWLGTHFSVQRNPGGMGWYMYYMYAVERTGRMTGSRFIGQHDWYREGAQRLLEMQNRAGGDFPTGVLENDRVVTTSFALLFLSKGKRQIVISRLQHGRGDDWNHHSRAMHHLTGHTERVWKRDLTWQTIDIRKATVRDLLESPVLFISGTQAINMDDQQRATLREYVEQGGFIFAESCNFDGCQGEAFEASFQKFVMDVFEHPLEKISPDHPIWFAESRVDPRTLPHDFWLYGVQSCCRLGLVYSPISLSCRWELHSPYGRRINHPPRLQTELDNATKVGLNVLAYATGKQLKEKLDAVSILENTLPTPPSDRGTLLVPKLRHNAGADDAPRALANLLIWLGRENPFQISPERRLIDIQINELQKYPVTFMHGRGAVKFNDRQRAALREYFENGGFLFADAICADDEFAISFRREMELILPQSKLERVPPDHPLLTRTYRGFDVRQVRMLDPTPTEDQLVAGERNVTPQLEMFKTGDRIAVVFSPLDLSCALESRHSLQCRGYVREDAARLGINIILMALQQ
jgi:hypothetical protein